MIHCNCGLLTSILVHFNNFSYITVTGVGVIGKDIALVKALLELSLEEKSVYILFRFSFEVLYTKTPARVGYFPIPYSGPE